jgi:predicted O-methyltransferase YrrM
LDTLIKNHPDSHLDCVDLWPDMGEQERLFDHNLSAEPQVTKHRDFSVNFLAPLVTQPPTYDFIYVDGDKRGEVLFSDLCLAWRCLKKKGVLAIDEYVYDGVDIAGVPGPQIAIDAFLKIIGREVRLLERNRQFIIQKRSEPLSAQDPL